jgi:hypothetical protein
MTTLATMLAQGYRFGAPAQEAEQMDTQVAESQPCPRCGGPMRYEGYHRGDEYVALAVCVRCGHELAF